MAQNWKPSQFRGVRYREDATRKHGVKADRYFAIRYQLNGKTKEEGIGWASEGMTAAKANEMRAMLMTNIRAGVRPQSLTEMRDMAEQTRQQEERTAKLRKRQSTTFAEFWESDYLPAATTSKKPKTVASETWIYSKWVNPALGIVPLQALAPYMVESIASQIKKEGKSAATIRHFLALISQVWNLAVSRNIVSGDSPTKRIKKPRTDNRRIRFLTPEEARRLLETLRGRSLDLHDSALLSLFAGLRAGEIHALTWSDVNLDAGTLYIRDPKNKVSRHAIATPEIREMLTRRVQDGQSPTSLVFPAKNGKMRLKISKLFDKVVTELGFNNGIEDARQKVVFHSLRHTFASWLVQRGVPLYTVAELMGHTTLEMTKRYSHLAPDTMRAAAMGLSGILDKKAAKVMPFRKRIAEGSE